MRSWVTLGVIAVFLWLGPIVVRAQYLGEQEKAAQPAAGTEQAGTEAFDAQSQQGTGAFKEQGQEQFRPGEEETSTAQQAREEKELELLFGRISKIEEADKGRSVIALDKPAAQIESPQDARVADRMMRVFLAPETQISEEGGKALQLSDLKVGEHVRVMYSQTWYGKRTAQSIEVLR